MSRIFRSALFAACIAVALPAVAGDGHHHHHAPSHGGVTAHLGESNAELVVRGDSLTLYLSEHDRPQASAGARASATVFAGNDRQTVVLEPAGDNRMQARGSFKSGVGVRVEVLLTLPGQAERKFNFRLK